MRPIAERRRSLDRPNGLKFIYVKSPVLAGQWDGAILWLRIRSASRRNSADELGTLTTRITNLRRRLGCSDRVQIGFPRKRRQVRANDHRRRYAKVDGLRYVPTPYWLVRIRITDQPNVTRVPLHYLRKDQIEHLHVLIVRLTWNEMVEGLDRCVSAFPGVSISRKDIFIIGTELNQSCLITHPLGALSEAFRTANFLLIDNRGTRAANTNRLGRMNFGPSTIYVIVFDNDTT